MSSFPTIKTRPITVVQDVPISKTLPFWEGLKQGKVLATKCKKCGKLYFPQLRIAASVCRRTWSGSS